MVVSLAHVKMLSLEFWGKCFQEGGKEGLKPKYYEATNGISYEEGKSMGFSAND